MVGDDEWLIYIREIAADDPRGFNVLEHFTTIPFDPVRFQNSPAGDRQEIAAFSLGFAVPCRSRGDERADGGVVVATICVELRPSLLHNREEGLDLRCNFTVSLVLHAERIKVGEWRFGFVAVGSITGSRVFAGLLLDFTGEQRLPILILLWANPLLVEIVMEFEVKQAYLRTNVIVKILADLDNEWMVSLRVDVWVCELLPDCERHRDERNGWPDPVELTGAWHRMRHEPSCPSWPTICSNERGDRAIGPAESYVSELSVISITLNRRSEHSDRRHNGLPPADLSAQTRGATSSKLQFHSPQSSPVVHLRKDS